MDIQTAFYISIHGNAYMHVLYLVFLYPCEAFVCICTLSFDMYIICLYVYMLE